MNRRIIKTILIALLALNLAISACGSTAATTPNGTQLSTPFPASVTPELTVPEPTSSIAMNPTTKPAVKTQPAVTVPPGLQVVYLMEGNLWSWTEAEGNIMLTGTGDITTARLSEDGQLLAFIRGREVSTVRMDGTDARLLVTQKKVGGSLWFAPDNALLAVSTSDHIDMIDLVNATIATVVTYPALSNGHYPEVVWSADSSGFKTVIPPASEKEQAEFLFVFPDGKMASLAKFSIAPVSEGLPRISPDGGYLIFIANSKDGKEALNLMDSSGASKLFGEPAENVRANGWLPDSKHFMYTWQDRTFLGNVKSEPPVELAVEAFELIHWVDTDNFLAMQDGNLYLGNRNGEKVLIADTVSDFDFGQ